MAPRVNPITFQSVTAPSNGAANALISDAIKNIGAGGDSLSNRISDFGDLKEEEATDEVNAQINAAKSQEERNAIVATASRAFLNVDSVNKTNIAAQGRENDQRVADSLNEKTQLETQALQRKEDNRVAHAALLTNSATLGNADWNTATKLYFDQGGTDLNGGFEAETKKRFRNDTSLQTIPEETFVTKYKINPKDNSTYNQEKYNQIVKDQADLIRAGYHGLSEEFVQKSAKDSVARTSHGRKFKDQTWFEDLTLTDRGIQRAALAKQADDLDYREKLAEVSEASKTDKYKNGDITEFNTKLGELDALVSNKEMSPARIAATKKFTTDALADHFTNQFDVEKSFGTVSVDANGNRVPNETFLSDFGPNQVQQWINTETSKLKTKFPHATPAELQQALRTKLTNSPLGPRVLEAAIPARVQAARAELEGSSAIAAEENYQSILTEMSKKGTTPGSFTIDSVLARMKNNGVSVANGNLSLKELNKVRNTLATARRQWLGYFPNIKGDQKGTLEVAIHRVLMDTYIDVDRLPGDPNDLAHDYINPTGDITNNNTDTKNRVMEMLLEKVSPSRHGFVSKSIEDKIKKIKDEQALNKAKDDAILNLPGLRELGGVTHPQTEEEKKTAALLRNASKFLRGAGGGN